MTPQSMIVAIALGVALAVLGLYLLVNPETVRNSTLDANRPIRNWPFIGRIADHFVQTPGYMAQLRIVAALMLVVALVLFALVVQTFRA